MRRLIVGFTLFAALGSWAGAAEAQARWTVRGLDAIPSSFDSGHFVEGTSTAGAWAWHSKLALSWAHDIGLADRAHQTRADLAFGLGLPAGFEVALAFLAGFTAGSQSRPVDGAQTRALVGMSEDGWAIGDLETTLMWSLAGASHGGLGLLVGASLLVPTGDHERLMGEGGLGAEPFVSASLSLLSFKLTFNLAYRIRPEHVAVRGGSRFEQDDDLIWRFAIRVPTENDVAWSLEAAGAIGFVTSEGPWPDARSRPVLLGGGADFPAGRLHRLGLFAGVGVVGEAVPDFQIGLRFGWLPVEPDEDGDGVTGRSDDCPLLAEDRDGFEDGDGCPDNDNDRDGFPDDEDRCPLDPAGPDSADGC